MKKYSDYGSYLSKLKYTNECCESLYAINKRLDELQNEIEGNNCLNNIQVIYNSPLSERIVVPNSCITFFENPIDYNKSTGYISYYTLPATNIPNGTSKRIINSCTITTTNIVNIISKQSNGVGAFNNLGASYNCYTFVCVGDHLVVTWNELNNNWSVGSYSGIFSNI